MRKGESFLRGEHTGSDLIDYARNGGWPHKRTPEEEASRKFLRRNPGLLLVIPDNQRLFSAEELEELMPAAQKDLEEGEKDLWDPWAEDDLGEE